MSERIQTLVESPCYGCEYSEECMERIKRSKCLMDICDYVVGRRWFDRHDCGIWIACDVDRKMKEDVNWSVEE